MTGEFEGRPWATVFVTVDNSSNGLTQNEWAFCVASVRAAIQQHAWTADEWFTESSSARQGVCWGIWVFTDGLDVAVLRGKLAREARSWKLEEIGWHVVTDEPISPIGPEFFKIDKA